MIVKKYANRRLYNTQTSSYVTLDHLCEMVKQGVDFEVRDARSDPGFQRHAGVDVDEADGRLDLHVGTPGVVLCATMRVADREYLAVAQGTGAGAPATAARKSLVADSTAANWCARTRPRATA